MQRVFDFFRRLFTRRPPVQWADGVVHTDPRYAVWYAETVAWVRSTKPDAPIFAPEMLVTVRLYNRFPKEAANGWGKVLAPNRIPGDIHGTLCLVKGLKGAEGLFKHEAKHAITGESGHPAWLFGPDRS